MTTAPASPPQRKSASADSRQRVFIARTLAGEPKMLILDEPAVGVDIASQEKFYSFLSYLNRGLKITIIFVSHDVGVIADEVNTVLYATVRRRDLSRRNSWKRCTARRWCCRYSGS